MKMLLVVRHAKSSWSNMNLSDFERPLNKRGKRDAPRMGELIKAEGLTPDLIMCSTAERALMTAELVALSCGYEGELGLTRDFYLAGPEVYLAALSGVADGVGCVMVVGHNPGMEELVVWLTGRPEFMSTANVACIALPIEGWGELEGDVMGELVNLWRPREV